MADSGSCKAYSCPGDKSQNSEDSADERVSKRNQRASARTVPAVAEAAPQLAFTFPGKPQENLLDDTTVQYVRNIKIRKR